MKDFENELDRIRVELYEETKGLCPDDTIKNVNSHAKKITHDFGIKTEAAIKEERYQAVHPYAN